MAAFFQAFFRSIVAVATYCGRRSIEQQVLPFIEKCLSDSEEFVVEETITAMTAMIELGHFRKALTIKLVADTLPLLQHPGIWIRYAVVALVAATARTLSVIDLHGILRLVQDASSSKFSKKLEKLDKHILPFLSHFVGHHLVVYTDGACANQGHCLARAGFGLFYGDGHPWNEGMAFVRTLPG